MDALIHYISELLKEKIKGYKPISGGDISQAFLLETSHYRYFLKVNSRKNALEMFKAEQNGLEEIRRTNTIATPKTFFVDQLNNSAFLLLEYVESKNPVERDFERFASQLTQMHQITSKQYGFLEDNFIGGLPQSNNRRATWTDFYINERLIPQFQLAHSKNLLSSNEIPDKELMKKTLGNLFKHTKPSLLHGDLWSGNFLITLDGTPFLIDPAVYYGHNEIDIAMSKLFGGFSNSFYKVYHEIIPQTLETHNRIELYQLYYLLVHLNLFGSSYYGSVKRILNQQFY